MFFQRSDVGFYGFLCVRKGFIPGPSLGMASLELQEKQDKIATKLYDEGKIKPDVMAIIKRMPESEKTGILSTIIEDAIREREESKK